MASRAGVPLWMVWNAALATLPFVLALVLFVRVRAGRLVSSMPESCWPLWCVGAVAFVAFLPNAPYVITDVVHLSPDLASVHARNGSTTLVLAQYAVLIAIGLGAYAGSLGLVRSALGRRGVAPAATNGIELGLHALCAVGVLLGRYPRFNSWDLATRTEDVVAHLVSRLDRPVSWTLLLVTFVVLTMATFFLRAFAIGLAATWRTRHEGP